MIFICVKWMVKREYADAWPSLTRSFTEATGRTGQPLLRVVPQLG